MNLQEQKTLTERLDKASKLYYNGQESEFTDTEFDLRLKELMQAEKDNQYVYPFSPTLRVGSDIQDNFKHGTHPKPMLTIENTYDDKGLESWLTSWNIENPVFNISVKYDGVSCELHYRDGILIEALTRGDKIVGDDITNNVRTIQDIPLKIERANVGDFYVRGEVLLPRTMLYYVNQEREKEGLPKLSNTRNACAGSIKQLDPKITAQRHLTFRAWDCFFMDEREDQWGDSMTTKFQFLQKIGFKYENGTTPFAMPLNEVIDLVNSLKLNLNYRSDINFDFDGIVIKLDSLALQKQLGESDVRAVPWAIARKWNEEYATSTKILGVEWSVGRTGNITPVAKLSPVMVDGVIISNASLNNEDYIRNLDLRTGDEVSVIRSGGVIPYVAGNLRLASGDFRTDGEIKAPLVCPSCGTPLIKKGANHFCPNKDGCKDQIIRTIEYWCSKSGMDIKGFGLAVIEDLYDRCGVKTVFDLYGWGKKDVKQTVEELGEGYGKKTVEKLITTLNESKDRQLSVILTSLGINAIGKVTARTIVKKFGSFQNIMEADTETIAKIRGVGWVAGRSIHDWMAKNGEIWLSFLNNEGFTTSNEKVLKTGENKANTVNKGKLSGMTLLFTGKSSYFSGDDVETFLESNGATIASGVSKKLTALITGDKPGGSKVKKAMDLGVPIIPEKAFIETYELKID